MKTFDFDQTVTSAQLNETLFKRFGSRIALENYDREELEKYRNLLRTKIHQTESSSKFNDLLKDETYQKDKHMLDVLNIRISEMLGEGAKVDRQAKHITKSMMKSHPGMSRDEAEGAAWAHIKHPKKKKKAQEGIEEKTMKTTEGKKIDQNKDGKNDWEDIKIARMKASGAISKDATSSKKVKETTGKFDKTDTTWTDKSGKKHPAQRVTRKTDQLAGGDEDSRRSAKTMKSTKTGKAVGETLKGGQKKLDKNHNGKLDKKDFELLRAKKSVKESIFRLHVRLVNESLKYLINEDEEGKAKAITAASDMVNDYTTWMQRVGQYQTKSMIELADSIRGEFGQAEADAFKNSVAPALASTLETLTAQREAISQAVAVLAGEATDQATMGAEPIPNDEFGGTEVPTDAGDDSMNTDEFGASDAAAGGAEAAGRMTRESRQSAKLRRIAESHSIMSRLAR